MWYRNLNIRRKILIGFGTIIILTMTLSAIEYMQLRKITSTYSNLVDNIAAQRDALVQVGSGYAKIRRIAAAAVIHVGNKEVLDLLSSDYALEKTDTESQFQRFFTFLKADSSLGEEEKEELEKSVGQIRSYINQKYDGLIQIIFEYAYMGESQAASDIFSQWIDTASDTDHKIQEIIQSAQNHMAVVSSETISQARLSAFFLLTVSGVVILLAVLYAILMANNIRKGIFSVTEAAYKVSKGDFNVAVGSKYKDEIALLSNSLLNVKIMIENMIKDIKNVNMDFNNGNIDARINLENYQGEFKNMSESINNKLESTGRDIFYIIGLITALGQGNFNIDVIEMPGKKKVFTDSFISVQQIIKRVNGEVNAIIMSAAEGNLDLNMNAELYEGDWKKLAAGINKMLGAVIKPVREAIDVMNQLSAGNLDASVKGDYKGEFAAMKTALNNTLAVLADKVEERTRELKLMTEKANQAAEAKTNFLASMSHEIRTPMNVIMGLSELLLTEGLTNKQYRYINDIKVSSNALLSIINDILDISKIEAGKFDLVPVHYNFPALMHNIISMMKFVAREKGLDFQMECSDNIPRCLYGDSTKLRQVLVNIIGNAVKFTDKGYVRIRITVTENTIQFAISDTGIGIKDKDINRIFDTFERFDEIKNHSKVGSGLGMSITKHIVTMMKGTIRVESVYKKGTTFYVEIPFVPGDESKMHEEAVGDFSFVNAPGAKILLVDDIEMNLNVGMALLDLCSIQYDVAMNGREAVEKVKERDYDLVFMDHMMPVMDGVEATEEIRRLGGKYTKLPIIALTANAIEGAKEIFLASGMDDFLFKPINKNELNRILKKWLPQEKLSPQGQPSPAEQAKPKNHDSAGKSRLAKIKEIQGLDAELGLERVGGLEDAYIRSLHIISRKIPEICASLTSYAINTDKPDLKSFAIDVHGIKGSLAISGHMELSAQAAELEEASKNTDLDFCVAQLPGFLEKLSAFGEKLEDALNDDGSSSQPKEEGSRKMLKEAFKKMEAACKEYREEAGLEEIKRLSRYSFGGETDRLIEGIRIALESFEFDQALELIHTI